MELLSGVFHGSELGSLAMYTCGVSSWISLGIFAMSLILAVNILNFWQDWDCEKGSGSVPLNSYGESCHGLRFGLSTSALCQ